ncbi:beta-secretase [Achlya hypogyna]|uniref:Beta-secretase n=1 Tax=Achlya hypogyna TaxID=1202772 RepID=A0A1V9YLL5_ACHHY|nr:beta-secretase [Achlya hypogyna]
MRHLRLTMALLTAVGATQVYQENLYGISTGISYYMKITIGQPTYSAATSKASAPNTFTLLIDTGSSNTAVATTSCCANLNMHTYSCAKSPTCEPYKSNEAVAVNYVVGSWSGILVQDTFSSPNITALPNIPFATVTAQTDFFDGGFDGILGMAFSSIAEPSSNPPSTVFEALVTQQTVADVFSLQLCGVLQPYVDGYTPISTAGHIVLGGIQAPNTSPLYRGQIFYTPLKKWYVVLVTGIGYGNSSLGFGCSTYNTPKAIVDSGTSNLVVPTAVYATLVAQIQAATLDAIPSFPLDYFSDSVVCCEAYCDPSNAASPLLSLPSISVTLAFGTDTNDIVSVSIPPRYYWRPIAASTGFKTSSCRIFGITEGSGTILGDVFMDGLFIVHDRAGAQLGLAVADNCANKANSSKTITLGRGSSWCDCLASTTITQSNLLSAHWPGIRPCFFWAWWTYVIVVSIAIVALCLVASIVLWLIKYRRRQRPRAQLQEVLLDGGPSPMLSSNTSDDIQVAEDHRRAVEI